MIDFNKVYEVVIFSVGETKSGAKMGKLQLKDTEDNTTLNCILWEETLNRFEEKIFRIGNLLKLVSATYNPQYNNCLVSALELVKEAKIGLDKAEQDEYFEKILNYAQKIKDEKLKKYVTSLLFEHEVIFKITPAARLMHHNYLGGLLVHTLECLEYADKITGSFFKNVNLDSVYAACILHDFGKIFEYTINEESGMIDYENNFTKEWISHSQWGFSNCMVSGFKEVAKMIATHHGRKEWGAILDLDEKDIDSIYYLMHHIDDLSAKFGKTTINEVNKK